MSRSKKLLFLLGVLAVVCVATFCVSRYQEHKEQIKTSDQIILEIPEESVTALSWTYDGQSLAFHKDEVWYYDEDETFPVNEDAISALLEGFQSFGVSFIIEEVEDYGQYGLDDPVCTIQLTTEDADYEIQLGDFSTMDSQRYVSIGDGNVYLVQEDPLDAFDVELSDLIANDSLPYVETADQLSIQGEDSLQITWQEESSSYREEDHYFVTVDGETQPLDTGLVEDFLYTLSGLDLTNYMTYNAGEDDLATYGLDDPERTITLDYTTQDENGNETAHTVSLAVSRAPAERWDDTQSDAGTETGEEEEVTAYARVDDSPIIYKITTEEYRALMDASYDTLRHKEILPADLENVSQVDVTLDGASYTLTASGEGEERTWSYGEQELETSNLPDALQALTADSFTEEEATGQEEISLTLHLSLEGEPTVSIQFCRYDGAYCLAVVDGQPTALVSRSQVVDLQEAVYAVALGES